ncbi:MAG: hypothetical protein WBP92_15335 [Candidatus Acidiferrales bacterium]
MASLEKAQRIGGAGLLSVPAFDFFAWLLDTYGRGDLLVSLHGHLPASLSNPGIGFLCMCGGLSLLYQADRRSLRPLKERDGRVLDSLGAEYRKIGKPKWFLSVLTFFLIAMVATPLLAIYYSLRNEGDYPTRPAAPTPPYWAYQKTPAVKRGPTAATRAAPNLSIDVQTSGPNSPAVGVNTGTVSVVSGDAELVHSLKVSFVLDVPTEKAKVDPSAGRSLGLMCPAALLDGRKSLYRLVTDGQFEDWQVSEGIHRFGFVYSPEDDSDLIGKKVEFLTSITTFAVNCSDFLKATGRTTNSPSDMSTYNLIFRVNGIVVLHEAGGASLKALSSDTTNELDISRPFSEIWTLYSNALAAQAATRPQ